MNGVIGMSGSLTMRKSRWIKSAPLSWRLRNALRWSYLRGLGSLIAGRFANRVFGVAIMEPTLRAVKIFKDGHREDYGIVGFLSVTTALVNFLVDQLQAEDSTIGDFKYHDSGVGTTAENITDTAIETTDGESRATGSQIEGATANIYKSVGTIAYTTSKAITEHGLFNISTNGTLMDRTVFAAINVVNGDSIEFTYQLTVSAGG